MSERRDMSEARYWFARRFPVGHPRNAMGPVNAEGWAVVRTFVAWMTAGAIVAVICALLGLYLNQWWLYVVAVVAYVACSVYGGWYFISTASRRGDPNNTVDDYKAGRVS
jgi:hypothetical protein